MSVLETCSFWKSTCACIRYPRKTDFRLRASCSCRHNRQAKAIHCCTALCVSLLAFFVLCSAPRSAYSVPAAARSEPFQHTIIGAPSVAAAVCIVIFVLRLEQHTRAPADDGGTTSRVYYRVGECATSLSPATITATSGPEAGGRQAEGTECKRQINMCGDQSTCKI